MTTINLTPSTPSTPKLNATTTWLKAASAAVLVALLAACGGNDVAPSANVGWASPAAFVPAGRSAQSFSLAGCSLVNEAYEGTLYNASLVINASGDVSILGATTATGAAITQFSIAYAQASQSNWQVRGTVEMPYIYMSVFQSGTGTYKGFSLGYGDEGETGLEAFDSVSATRIGCDAINAFTLQINPDAARAAKNLGTGAGVNAFDDEYADGRIEGGNAFWSNGDGFGAPDRTEMRFNLSTGALASATSTSATYTAISLALPTTASNDEGSYSESLIRNSSKFNNSDAKLLCLLYRGATQEGFSSLEVVAYGNQFRPNTRGDILMSLSSQREKPQRESFGCDREG